MSTTSSLSPCCNSGVVRQIRSSRRLSTFDLAACHVLKHSQYSCRFLGTIPRSQSLNTSLQRLQNGSKMDISVKNNILPDIPPLPTDVNSSDPGSWKLWLMGVFFSIVIPFWRNKWAPLKKLQEQVEKVVDTAQEVTDIIEDVAKGVEKVADDIGDRLPKGGKLQEVASFVEDMAEGTLQKISHLRLAQVVRTLCPLGGSGVQTTAPAVVEEVENKVEDFLEDQTTKKEEEKTVEKETQTLKASTS